MTLTVTLIKRGLFAEQLLGTLFFCEKNAAVMLMACTRHIGRKLHHALKRHHGNLFS